MITALDFTHGPRSKSNCRLFESLVHGVGKVIQPEEFSCTRKDPLHTPARPALRNEGTHDVERPHSYVFVLFSITRFL